MMNGLRARYFVDSEFNKLALERLEKQIDYPNRQFPLPAERQENISAEWRGFLAVEKEGEYVFFPDARSWVGLYVDGAGVGWNSRIKLEAGRLYDFKVVFRQNQPGAESWARIHWDVPGAGRKSISDVFMCAPWFAKLEEVKKAVKDLASKNPEEVKTAQLILREAGAVSGARIAQTHTRPSAGKSPRNGHRDFQRASVSRTSNRAPEWPRT